MKKYALLALSLLLLATGCQKKDIHTLQNRITDLEGQLSTLKTAVNTVNDDIKSLQAITTALQNKITINSYAATAAGYLLTMSNGTVIELKNGINGTNGVNGADAPSIGVKQDTDGRYYWTLAGAWLLQNGEKLPATGKDGNDGANGTDGTDGITPLLRINTDSNYWMISYNGGVNWQPVTDAAGNTIPATGSGGATGPQGPQGDPGPQGPAGITGFSISETDVAIIITYMGSSYTIPKTGSGSAATGWQIAAGYNDFTLFVNAAGNLFATGGNARGQLGIGTTLPRSAPAFVLDGVKAVAAGYEHTLILKSDGKLYATGLNRDGQLGLASGTAFYTTPQYVTDNVKAVAAGNNHSLILKSDGKLYAMGSNNLGQLCITGHNSSVIPLFIMDGVKAVAAGNNCSLILKSDGNLYASTFNIQTVTTTIFDPTLGPVITTVNYGVPRPPVWVSGSVKDMKAYTDLYFVSNDGSLYQSKYFVSETIVIPDGTESAYVPSAPEYVTDNTMAIAAGTDFVLVLKNGGGLFARGNNAYGNFGTGDTDDRAALSPVIAGVQAAAAGNHHTVIVKNDGSLFGTGLNNNGQLGLGNTTNKKTFTLIPGFE